MNIKVKVEDMIYEVEIDDINSIPVIAHIGDESFVVWPEQSQETVALPHRNLRHTPATGMQTNSKDRIVPAPLPGTITEVFVQAGNKVEVGDPLLIIEAMKMKNTIRSGRSGTIASIHIQPGEAVKHHQPVIEFTE
jgi:biotin carboxyl carrier protein